MVEKKIFTATPGIKAQSIRASSETMETLETEVASSSLEWEEVISEPWFCFICFYIQCSNLNFLLLFPKLVWLEDNVD